LLLVTTIACHCCLFTGGQSSAGSACASDGCEGDEEDEAQVVLSDVPLEVVAVILQSLDPLSLAAAACVCRYAQHSTAQHSTA